MSIPANLASGAFAGTASDYARFRPSYPAALLHALAELSPTHTRALDLACGPGRIALDLAGRFDEVWAIDLEPDMIAVGPTEAARRGLSNLHWFCGPAETLLAPSGNFDLITVGEAFHRLDQAAVLALAMRALRPGGVFATLGSRGLLSGDEPWQRTVSDVARRWMDRAFPAGWGSGSPTGPDHDPPTFRAAGLTDITIRSYDQPYAWNLEAIMGYLRSTSVCSTRALGDDYRAFESELRAALGSPDHDQSFNEILNFGFVAGRTP